MTIFTIYWTFSKQVMTIRAVLMCPLFAKSLDFTWIRSGDCFTISGNRDILMTDKTFTYPFRLVKLMIEYHSILKLYYVRCWYIRGNEKHTQ